LAIQHDNSDHPLSLSQQKLWIAQKATDDAPIFNLLATYEIQGLIDADRFVNACDLAVSDSDVLQSTFHTTVDGEPRQCRDQSISAQCQIIKATSSLCIADWSRQEGLIPLDLSSRCFRLALLQITDNKSVFHISVHHLVADGGILALFWKQVVEHYLYLENPTSEHSCKPEPFAPYFEHINQELRSVKSQEHQSLLDYWDNRKVTPAPPLQWYGTAEPKITSQSDPYFDFKITRHTWLPNHSTLTQLEAVRHSTEFSGRSWNMSLFIVLATSMLAVAHRLDQQTNQRLGFPVRSRTENRFKQALGLFVSQGFLDLDISDTETFASLAVRVRENVIDAIDHLSTSIQSAQINRSFSSSLNIILATAVPLGNRPVRAVARTNGYADDNTQLELHVTDLMGDGQLNFMFDFSETHFDLAAQNKYIEHFKNTLNSLLTDPTQSIAHFPLLSPYEIEELQQYSKTEASLAIGTETLHSRFKQIAQLKPDAIALIYEGKSISFNELYIQSEKLAHHLNQQGITKGSAVAVCVHPSINLYIALLAVLMAEAAYVPLDPAYPKARLDYMRQDSQSCHIICEKSTLTLFDISDSGVTVVDDAWVSSRISTNKPLTSYTNQPAYIMYTSGSSGQPKGVVGTHSATLNRLEWMWKQYPYKAEEVCCQKTALSFVDSVAEIFSPLLVGIPTVILSHATVLDVYAFTEALKENKVTRLLVVPTLLSLILDSDEKIADTLKNLTLCTVSGEPLPPALANRFQALLPHTKLLNLYGSTEVSADVTFDEVLQKDSKKSMPIGRPIAGIQIFIVDKNIQLLPQGTVGQIAVAGEGLSAGYFNSPELTEEKFRENPFGKGKLFLTGDLGRLRANGVIEHFGRADKQLKNHGRRFEPTEIELATSELAGIDKSIVELINKKIHLFYTMESNSSVDNDSVLKHLQAALPSYMVPGRITQLEIIPTLSNGKVDRAEIIRNHSIEQSDIKSSEPATPTEAMLLSLWLDVLDTEKIDLTQDFFSIGGDSVQAIRLAMAANNLGIEISLRDLFGSGSIRDLAATLDINADAVTTLTDNSTDSEKKLNSYRNRIRQALDQFEETASIKHRVDENQWRITASSRFEPITQPEIVLQNAFRNVLHKERIDLTAGLFDLGGDSITAMRIMVAVKREGFSVDLQAIMDSTSIELLADSMRTAKRIRTRL